MKRKYVACIAAEFHYQQNHLDLYIVYNVYNGVVYFIDNVHTMSYHLDETQTKLDGILSDFFSFAMLTLLLLLVLFHAAYARSVVIKKKKHNKL